MYSAGKTAFLFAALAITGCVDAASDEVSVDEAALINAPLDKANPWAVGICAGPLNTDPNAGPLGACLTPGTRCTGSLIAPNLVLTARHCVHKKDFSQATHFCDARFTNTPVANAPVRVTVDPSVLGSNIHWRAVDQILTDTGTLSCRDDIAILVLSAPVPWFVAKPVRVQLSDLTADPPSEYAIVGRGSIHQRFDTTTYEVIEQDNGGLRRRVLEHIPFACVSNTLGDCIAADIGAPFEVDPGYLQIGAAALSGDSGSGVLRQSSFPRRPAIVAVQSAGTADPITGLPNFGFGTRLDIHAAFVQAALDNH